MQTISFKVDGSANFAPIYAEMAQLRRAIVALQKTPLIGATGAAAVKDIKLMQQQFDRMLASTRAFSNESIRMTSGVEKMAESIAKGQLKLHDYWKLYREATKQTAGMLDQVATQQARISKSFIIPDILKPGYAKLITNLTSSIQVLGVQAEQAAIKQRLLNTVIRDGATQVINLGKNTQWAGRQLTVGLTVPLMAFGAQASRAFMDVDKQLTRMVKVYGDGLTVASQQTLSTIRSQSIDLAKELARTYGMAMEQTTAAAADLAATGLQGQDLLNATRETMRLATLGELDQQQAIRATIALQRTFRLSSSELADSVNYLNAVENQTSTSLQDIVEALPRASVVVKELGGSYKDVAAMMVAMREAGVPAAEAANSIKSAMASIINPSKKAREDLKAFGIDIQKIVNTNAGDLIGTILELQGALDKLDSLSRTRIIEEIFGKFQFAKVTALLDNLGKAGSQSQKAFELAGASASQLAKLADQELKQTTESISGRWKKAMETLKANFMPIGQQIVKVGTAILNVFNKVLAVINKLGPLKNILGVLIGGVGIAGPLIMISGIFINLVGQIIKAANYMRMFRQGLRDTGTIAGGFKNLSNFFELVDKSSLAAQYAMSSVGKATDNTTKSFDVLLNRLMMLRQGIKELATGQVTLINPALINQIDQNITGQRYPVAPYYSESGKQIAGVERPHMLAGTTLYRGYGALTPEQQLSQYPAIHMMQGLLGPDFEKYMRSGLTSQFGMAAQGLPAFIQQQYKDEPVIYGGPTGLSKEQVYTREIKRVIDLHDRVLAGTVNVDKKVADELKALLGEKTTTFEEVMKSPEAMGGLTEALDQVTFSWETFTNSQIEHLVNMNAMLKAPEESLKKLNNDLKAAYSSGGSVDEIAAAVRVAWTTFQTNLLQELQSDQEALAKLASFRTGLTAQIAGASSALEASLYAAEAQSKIAIEATGSGGIYRTLLGPTVGRGTGLVGQSLSHLGTTSKPGGYAPGGYVSGPGGPTDDKIPAMLSDGEFVIRASSVNKYGRGFLDGINKQKYAKGGLIPGFVDGTDEAIDISQPAEAIQQRLVAAHILQSARIPASTITDYPAYFPRRLPGFAENVQVLGLQDLINFLVMSKGTIGTGAGSNERFKHGIVSLSELLGIAPEDMFGGLKGGIQLPLEIAALLQSGFFDVIGMAGGVSDRTLASALGYGMSGLSPSQYDIVSSILRSSTSRGGTISIESNRDNPLWQTATVLTPIEGVPRLTSISRQMQELGQPGLYIQSGTRPKEKPARGAFDPVTGRRVAWTAGHRMSMPQRYPLQPEFFPNVIPGQYLDFGPYAPEQAFQNIIDIFSNLPYLMEAKGGLIPGFDTGTDKPISVPDPTDVSAHPLFPYLQQGRQFGAFNTYGDFTFFSGLKGSSLLGGFGTTDDLSDEGLTVDQLYATDPSIVMPMLGALLVKGRARGYDEIIPSTSLSKFSSPLVARLQELGFVSPLFDASPSNSSSKLSAATELASQLEGLTLIQNTAGQPLVSGVDTSLFAPDMNMFGGIIRQILRGGIKAAPSTWQAQNIMGQLENRAANESINAQLLYGMTPKAPTLKAFGGYISKFGNGTNGPIDSQLIFEQALEQARATNPTLWQQMYRRGSNRAEAERFNPYANSWWSEGPGEGKYNLTAPQTIFEKYLRGNINTVYDDLIASGKIAPEQFRDAGALAEYLLMTAIDVSGNRMSLMPGETISGGYAKKAQMEMIDKIAAKASGKTFVDPIVSAFNEAYLSRFHGISPDQPIQLYRSVIENYQNRPVNEQTPGYYSLGRSKPMHMATSNQSPSNMYGLSLLPGQLPDPVFLGGRRGEMAQYIGPDLAGAAQLLMSALDMKNAWTQNQQMWDDAYAGKIQPTPAMVQQTGANWVSNVGMLNPLEWATGKPFAWGGHVFGAGGPTEDKIPAYLSNGEFVMNANAVKKYGSGFMYGLNAGKYARGGLIPGFATGSKEPVHIQSGAEYAISAIEESTGLSRKSEELGSLLDILMPAIKDLTNGFKDLSVGTEESKKGILAMATQTAGEEPSVQQKLQERAAAIQQKAQQQGPGIEDVVDTVSDIVGGGAGGGTGGKGFRAKLKGLNDPMSMKGMLAAQGLTMGLQAATMIPAVQKNQYAMGAISFAQMGTQFGQMIPGIGPLGGAALGAAFGAIKAAYDKHIEDLRIASNGIKSALSLSSETISAFGIKVRNFANMTFDSSGMMTQATTKYSAFVDALKSSTDPTTVDALKNIKDALAKGDTKTLTDLSKARYATAIEAGMTPAEAGQVAQGYLQAAGAGYMTRQKIVAGLGAVKTPQDIIDATFGVMGGISEADAQKASGVKVDVQGSKGVVSRTVSGTEEQKANYYALQATGKDVGELATSTITMMQTSNVSQLGKTMSSLYDPKNKDKLDALNASWFKFKEQLTQTDPELAKLDTTLKETYKVDMPGIVRLNALMADGFKLSAFEAGRLGEKANSAALKGAETIQNIKDKAKSIFSGLFTDASGGGGGYGGGGGNAGAGIQKEIQALQKKQKAIQDEMAARQKAYELGQQEIQQQQTLQELINNAARAAASGDLIGMAEAQSKYNAELAKQNELKDKQAKDEADQAKIDALQKKIDALQQKLNSLSSAAGGAATATGDLSAAQTKVNDAIDAAVNSGNWTDLQGLMSEITKQLGGDAGMKTALDNAGVSLDTLKTKVAEFANSKEGQDLASANGWVAKFGDVWAGVTATAPNLAKIKSIAEGMLINYIQENGDVIAKSKDPDALIKGQLQLYVKLLSSIFGIMPDNTAGGDRGGKGKSDNKGGGSHGVGGSAYGGYISGPGGPREDLIPAMLSNGEYVVQAAAVGKYGVQFMNALNAGQIGTPTFNTGGIVPSYRFARGGSVAHTTSNNPVYNVNVHVAGSSANAEEIARVVMKAIERKEKTVTTHRRLG